MGGVESLSGCEVAQRPTGRVADSVIIKDRSEGKLLHTSAFSVLLLGL